jgi:tetratricopeptide (TPR) repeat protein
MKRLATLSILIVFILSGCISSKRLLQNGAYDTAIGQTARKLMRNPDKEKQIAVLTQAYKDANQKDLDNITYLKSTGEPDIWDKIFDTYFNMKNRQEIVRVLPQAILDKIGYQYVNYDQEIFEAKKKAAAYFYVHAQSLLKQGDRANARIAYEELQKVKAYYNSYKDSDSLIQIALNKGTANVLFKIKNQTTILLPADFEAALTKISISDLDKLWLNYDVNEVKGRTYAYVILVNIKGIDVSPESVKETHYTETKEVQDGFTYQLDTHGNVVKDSLGNDIKIPKYKTISCDVVETHQMKTAIISGTLDCINNESNQLIKTDPLTAQSLFENYYVFATGDINALKPETKAKIGNRPMPFPSNPVIILQAGDVLKGMVKNIIWNNKNIFE